MGTLVVKTNHHVRDIVHPWDLTPAEREQFDYLDWAALEEGTDSRQFVRYLGDLIDLSDMDGRAPESLPGWDLYSSDSFWSGIVVRFFDAEGGLLDDGQGVVVGRYWQEG